MFLIWYVLFILHILIVSGDEETETEPEEIPEDKNKEYQCFKLVEKLRRRRWLFGLFGSSKKDVKQAMNSAGNVLSTSGTITGIIDGASSDIGRFLPIADAIRGFIPAVRPLAMSIGDVSKVVDYVLHKPPEPPQPETSPWTRPDKRPEQIERNAAEEAEKVKATNKQRLEDVNQLRRAQTEKNDKQVRENAREIRNFSREQTSVFKEMTRKQDQQYEASMRTYKINQKVAAAEAARFENISAQQAIQYNITLQTLESASSFSDMAAQQFINLSANQAKQYEISQKSLETIKGIRESQIKGFENLTQQFEDNAKKQMEKISDVSNQLDGIAEDQTKEFSKLSNLQEKEFNDMSKRVDSFTEGQLANFKELAKEQAQFLGNISADIQDIKQQSDQTMQQLSILSGMISEGFAQLHEQMDEGFSRVEKKIGELHETTLFLAYVKHIQNPIRKLDDVYVEFTTKMKDITSNPKSIETAMEILIQKCCSIDPTDILARMYHKIVSSKQMTTSNIFMHIYNQYFAKDSVRMMNLFQYIMNDVFKALQMVTICDDITHSRGLGVEEAKTRAVEIAEKLDEITAKMESETFHTLSHQTPIMDEIVKEWTKRGQSADLGCGVDELNDDFTKFALKDLNKRFHYMSFFMVVTGYNKIETAPLLRSSSLEQPPLWCGNGDNSSFGFFVYNRLHSSALQQEEDYNKRKMTTSTTLATKTSSTTTSAGNETTTVEETTTVGNVTTTTTQTTTTPTTTETTTTPTTTTTLETTAATAKKRNVRNVPRNFERFKEERLMMITTFLPRRITVNTACNPTTTLFCPKNGTKEERRPNALKHGLACYVPYHYNQHVVCGLSGAEYPFNMKYCNRGMKSLMLGVCA